MRNMADIDPIELEVDHICDLSSVAANCFQRGDDGRGYVYRDLHRAEVRKIIVANERLREALQQIDELVNGWAGETVLERVVEISRVAYQERARLEMKTQRLLNALQEAAESLSSISRLAGIDEYMLDQSDVRAYAASRAKVATTVLDQEDCDDFEKRPRQ